MGHSCDIHSWKETAAVDRAPDTIVLIHGVWMKAPIALGA
jgi:hypothetical protein